MSPSETGGPPECGSGRRLARHGRERFRIQIGEHERRRLWQWLPLRTSWRLVGAVGYLALDIAALAAAFAAAGHPLPVAPLVLAYLIGYLANLIPVPGGFGVLEGGLAGARIAYSAPATQATAAVIVYHAIAFWVPSLGGLLGYALLNRRASRTNTTSTTRHARKPPFVPRPQTHLTETAA